MITPPWYDSPIETLAFNLYAIREEQINTAINALSNICPKECLENAYQVQSILDSCGLSDITYEELNRIREEVYKHV